jgi:hypothetical protein
MEKIRVLAHDRSMELDQIPLALKALFKIT